MSYIRWSDESNVYVYPAQDKARAFGNASKLVCCHANKGEQDFECRRVSEMIVHLVEHKTNGDKVPDVVFTRLLDEKKRFGDKAWNWRGNRYKNDF